MATATQTFATGGSGTKWGAIVRTIGVPDTWVRALVSAGQPPRATFSGGTTIWRGFWEVDMAVLVAAGYTVGTALTSATLSLSLTTNSGGAVKMGVCTTTLADGAETMYNALDDGTDTPTFTGTGAQTYTLGAGYLTTIAAAGATDKFCIGMALINEGAAGAKIVDATVACVLTITYTPSTPLTVTRADDYDPNQTAVSGTLRWALFNQSGDRTVTVDAAVVTSGIDLNSSATYGPVVVSNPTCDFDGGGVEIRQWGISVAASDVTLDDFSIETNTSVDGRAIRVINSPTAQNIQNVTVSNAVLTATSVSAAMGVSQIDIAGSFDDIHFENISIDAVSEDAAVVAMLITGVNSGAVNGKFTYTNLAIGVNEPVAGRVPVVFGGLHTFTDCEFVQAWETTLVKAAHVNWIRCNWTTRAEPPGAGYWYAGRLVLVSYPATTRMYFEDCTLDGAPATYEDLCKVWSVNGDADIDPSVISGTLLTTIPQNPTPTISNLSPSSYFAGGVNNVVITGTGFRPNSTVTVNSVSVPFTLTDDVNGTIITARVPSNVFAAPGTFNVTVSNPAPTGGTSSASSLTVTGLGRRSGGTSCMIATGTI